MRFIETRHFVVLALAAATAGLLPGCGQKSERELLDAAKARLQKNEPQAAIIELKTALQAYPQSSEARVLLGETLLKNGAGAHAVLELEKARELKASDATVLPLLARAMLAAGQAKKMLQRFENTTLNDPIAAADLKTSVALAHGFLGARDRSETLLDEVLKVSPKNSIARLEKARLLGLRRATDEALVVVGSLVADEPKNTGAMQLRGDLLLGGKGDADGAEKSFRQALAADERFVPAHVALIALAQKQGNGEMLKTQVAALKKVAPNSLPARFFAAQLALAEGKLTEARDGAQELLRLAPSNPQFLHLAGVVELRVGTLILAESHLNRALQQMPEAAATRRLLAQTYLHMGQGAKALNVLAPLMQESGRPDAEALTLAAQAHLQAGEKAAADKYFARAIKADPNDPKLRSALALSQISKGDVDAGFKQLESAAARDKGLAADLALINARLHRNDLDSALQAVERLQAKIPDKPLPHYLLGRIALNKGDRAKARASFEKAIGLDPGYYAVAASLASMDVEDKEPARALKRFEDVLARDPRSYRAVLAVVDLRQNARAKPEEIAGLLADVIKRSPSEPTLRLRLVSHHVAQRNLKDALAAAQDAVAALPDDMRVLDALGEVQLATGNTQQAITSFGKAAAAQPKATAPLVRLADAYARTNDSASAAKALRRALDISPTLLQAQQGLVKIALAHKRYDEAAAIVRDVVKQRPASPMGYVLDSEVRTRQQQWDAAIAAARAALERGKTSDLAARLHVIYVMAGRRADSDRFVAEWEREHPNDADFQSELATLALASKDLPEAEARFRKVLSVKPNDVMALNNLAWVLTQQNKPGAVNLAQRAQQLRPDSPSLIDTLASAYAAEKRLAEAIEWQRKAIAIAPDAAHYRLKLARWLASSGDKAGARAELDTLAKLGAKFSEQAQVRALLKTLPD